MKHRSWADLPLQRKLNIFGTLSSGLLLFTSVCCILFFSYIMLQFEQSIGDSYQQSSLLSNLARLNEDVQSYGTYPTQGTAALISDDLSDVDNLLRYFSEHKNRQTMEQGILLRAIAQTMQSYEETLQELYAMQPSADKTSQAFSICLSKATEIGSYADSYAKQLIQITLQSGRDDYDAIRLNLQWLTLSLIVLFVMSVILNWHFRHLVSAQILLPVMTLANAASTLVSNNMDIPDVEPVGQGEVSDLIQNFNRMKADCRSLISAQEEKARLEKHLFDETIRRIDTEKQLSAVRFSMLKNQINPHFLFNALNLIIQTAHQECAGETETLIQKLSALLRYTLYNDRDIVPLSMELDILHSYMYIQESRFRDRLLFWVECGVDPEEIMVPAFCLQPLVENAVSHGISPKEEGGMIRVKITEQSGVISIFVTDSGVGIDKETLAQLRAHQYMRRKENKKSGGIGVENVAVRFSMMYPDGSFRIRSKRGLGTDILLRFCASDMKHADLHASAAKTELRREVIAPEANRLDHI